MWLRNKNMYKWKEIRRHTKCKNIKINFKKRSVAPDLRQDTNTAGLNIVYILTKVFHSGMQSTLVTSDLRILIWFSPVTIVGYCIFILSYLLLVLERHYSALHLDCRPVFLGRTNRNAWRKPPTFQRKNDYLSQLRSESSAALLAAIKLTTSLW